MHLVLKKKMSSALRLFSQKRFFRSIHNSDYNRCKFYSQFVSVNPTDISLANKIKYERKANLELYKKDEQIRESLYDHFSYIKNDTLGVSTITFGTIVSLFSNTPNEAIFGLSSIFIGLGFMFFDKSAFNLNRKEKSANKILELLNSKQKIIYG
jgi:hypothetical protein